MNSKIRSVFHSNRFVMSVARNGCVDKIVPVMKSVKTKFETIGAIADENAVSTERMSHYLNPNIHGDCLVHDQLAHKVYSFRFHGKQPRDWRAVQKWTDQREYWEWELEIRHKGGPEREMMVELSLPHPIFPGAPRSGHSNWSLGTPGSLESSCKDYGIRKLHYCKCLDEKTDVPLPLCTLFHSGPDVSLGLSYLLPPDLTWYTDFEVDQRNWTVKITFSNLALVKRGKITLKFWLFSHEGDWRPALGWLREKFPGILGPVPGQEKIDGNMAYTVAAIPERRIAAWADKMKLKWNETVIFRDISSFAPDEPFDASHFKTPEHPEWSADNLTYDKVRKYVEMCHKHGVMVMPYFNMTDGESELVEKKFPECIARLTNGEKLITWRYYDRTRHTLLMNCDPQYPYFDFILAQFEKILKKIPEIDGFFFDQACYGWIDTAHFDGVTFYNNRPAYNLKNAYLRAFKKLRAVFPRPRIIGMANGVMCWQMMKYVDGVMAEGDPKMMERLSLLALERPSICLAEGEYAFQNALYYGAWLHVSPYYRYPTSEPLPQDALKLFSAYNPLFEFLEGRRWVYTANPISVTINSENIYKDPLLKHGERIRANIFRTFWGEYAIVIPAVPRGLAYKNSSDVSLAVKVKVPENKGLKQAVIFGADYPGYVVEKTVMSENGYLDIKVPRHGAATMVLLVNNFKRLRAVKDWAKFSENKAKG